MLTGKVERVDDQVFKTDDLQVRFTEKGAWFRPAPSGEGKELIIKLDLPAGESNLLLDYELLR